jgi:hypothetical protein
MTARWTHKNKHRYQSGDGLVPAGKFLGGSFGVSGTLPGVIDSGITIR